MIEIWLGLLLGEQEQYQWETNGEFYKTVEETWLKLELVNGKHHNFVTLQNLKERG
jgi:hypothetical protein